MVFTAIVRQEGALHVAQCVEVDVASQGVTVEEALANLREALELYFEDGPSPPTGKNSVVRTIEVNLGANA